MFTAGKVMFDFILLWSLLQLTSGLNNSNEKSKLTLKELITNLIEKQRDELRKCDGVDKDPKLPCMEPLNIKHQPFNIKHSIGEFHGSVDKIVMNHLTYFDVVDVQASLLMKANVTLNFPKIYLINGNYKVNGVIGDPPLFNLFGEGKFDLTMINLLVHIDMALGYTQIKKYYIKSISINVSIQGMEAYFHNLMGGGEQEEIFNKIINEIAPFALDTLWPEIKPVVDEKAKEVADELVKDLNLPGSK